MLHIFFYRVWESYHISTDGKSSGSSKSCFSTWVRWRYEFRLYLYQVSQISLINQEILESVADAINFDLWVEREEF